MNELLLVLAVLVSLAVASTRTATRWGVPSLVLFVALGMLAGSSGPGGVEFSNYQLAYDFGTLALAIILFSGGIDTNLARMKTSLAPALALSTVGVVVKLLLMASLARLVTPLDWPSALLLGAVLAPTDAAAVFSVLRGAGLSERLKGILEAESGTNDPMAIYLTIAFATALTGGAVSIPALLGGVVLQLGLGLVAGVAFGLVLVGALRRLALDGSGLYPVFALAGGIGVFALTNLIGGNGFLAIYATGLVMASRHTTHVHEIRTSLTTLAWGAQIGMFLLLGLLAFPDRLITVIGPALVLAGGMILVARPLSVIVSILPMAVFRQYRYEPRELCLLSWAGLKGAVPIILAIFPLLNGVSSGEMIFDIVFVVVIIGTLVQGSTTVPIARYLGLSHPEPPRPPITLELGGDAPSGSAMRSVWLEETTPAVGRCLRDLALAEDTIVSAVVRDGHLLAPRGGLVLQEADHVFVMTVDDAPCPAVLLPVSGEDT